MEQILGNILFNSVIVFSIVVTWVGIGAMIKVLLSLGLSLFRRD